LQAQFGPSSPKSQIFYRAITLVGP
jgi:hypothetical protein